MVFLRNMFFIFVFSVLLIPSAFAEQKDLSWMQDPTRWGDPEIIKLLKSDPVVEVRSMRGVLEEQKRKIDFEGKVHLLTLKSGLKAIFKPREKDDNKDTMAEVAAFKASQILGFPTVPPTTLRTIGGTKGSIHLYVETDVDALNPKIYKQAFKDADPEGINNMKIFDYLFGKWDYGPHNMLIAHRGDKTYLVSIDNESISHLQFSKFGQAPFVRIAYSENIATNDWGKPFPFDKAKTISKPTPETLRKEFGDKLPEGFYSSFKYYNSPLVYVLYLNSIWKQFHSETWDWKPDHCSSATVEKIKLINKPWLDNIFSDAKGEEFLRDIYFKAFFARKDELLNNCTKH